MFFRCDGRASMRRRKPMSCRREASWTKTSCQARRSVWGYKALGEVLMQWRIGAIGWGILMLSSGGRQTSPSLDGGQAADGEVLVAQVATNVLQVKNTEDTIVINMVYVEVF
jgi:hypothetical protein